MNTRNMIYTRQARWWVDTHTVVGCDDQLRCAVFLLTPHQNHFIEFTRYTPPEERIATAARLVRKMFDKEVWFRRPRTIRSGCRVLTAAVKESMDGLLPIRTDTGAARLRTAKETFELHVAETTRRRAWLTMPRVAA